MSDDPAFPALEPTGGNGFDLQFRGLTIRQYFAAHAPEVPQDFARLRVDYVAGFGRNRHIEKRDEAEMDRLIRWRWAYADAMAIRVNTDTNNAKPGE